MRLTAPRAARGMYFSSADVGQMSAMIYNWPEKHVRTVQLFDHSAPHFALSGSCSFPENVALTDRWT